MAVIPCIKRWRVVKKGFPPRGLCPSFPLVCMYENCAVSCFMPQAVKEKQHLQELFGGESSGELRMQIRRI